jgi:hypothetical protein
MSFGKRSNGEGHPARNLLPVQPAEESGEAPVARMKVANPGGIVKGFIALAAGVVLVSAGAAIAAPSVIEMMSGTPVRPIEVVVAGLKRDEVKVALAREAFPDNEGRAFMTSLQSKFPKDHDLLLGALADRAMDGGDREDLIQEFNLWTMDFAPGQFKAIARTGNDGFDKVLGVFTDALNVVEKSTGGCTLNTMRTFLDDPTSLGQLSAFGSEGYKVGMRSTRTLVDLAHDGRDNPLVDTELTRDDVSALQTTFFSLMMDEQVMGLMSSMGGGNSYVAQEELASNFNVCQLGRTVVVKLKKLPHPTKARLLAVVLSNADMSSLSTLGGMGGPSFSQPMLGPPSFPNNWEPPGWDN